MAFALSDVLTDDALEVVSDAPVFGKLFKRAGEGYVQRGDDDASLFVGDFKPHSAPPIIHAMTAAVAAANVQK